MQHPAGYRLGPGGEIELSSFWGLLLNKWALWQYAHNMLGAVQTGCFVMAGVGSFYLLTKRDEDYGRTFVRTGVLVGTIAALLQLFPTGDMQGKMIAYSQPPTLAAIIFPCMSPVGKSCNRERRSRFWANRTSRNGGWTILSNCRTC